MSSPLERVPIYEATTITPFRCIREENKLFGAVYDKEGHLIRDSQRHSQRLAPHDPETIPLDIEGLRVFSAVYCGHMFDHFGHFLTETLPQCYWSQLDAQYIIFHPWTGYSRKRFPRNAFIPPLLEAAGIDRSRLLIADQYIHIDKLYLPDRSNFIIDRKMNTPESLEVYKNISENLSITGTPARIFFSRRNWHKNRNNVANQIELEQKFAEWGFEIYMPEELPVIDQVKLAASADIMAGEIGSALHLSVFMKPGTRVIGLGRTFDNLVRFSDALAIQTDLLDFSHGDKIDINRLSDWLLTNLPPLNRDRKT